MSKKLLFAKSFVMLMLVLVGWLPAMAEDQIEVTATSSQIIWSSVEPLGTAQVAVSGPGDYYVEHHMESGESIAMPLDSHSGLADGLYRWRLTTANELAPWQREALAVARAAKETRQAERLLETFDFRSQTFTGYLQRRNGQWVVGLQTKGAEKGAGQDLVVEGQACIGSDCVPGEIFDSETLKLKTDAPVLRFEDTSLAPGDPKTDWQIVANDAVNGGAERLFIEDLDQGTEPFSIEAQAPDHSLYVTNSGRLGLGTSTPAVSAHVLEGQEPALRLEQDGSKGLDPQAWDLAGDDQSVFIRDVTQGTVPLRIEAGALDGSVHVDSDGDLGLGTSDPAERLHITGADGDARVLIEDTSATVAQRVQLHLEGNGTPTLLMTNADQGANWFLANRGDLFSISRTGTGVNELNLTSGGDMDVFGDLTADNFSSTTVSTSFVGIGPYQITPEPTQELRINNPSGITQLVVEDTSATVAHRIVAELRNNGTTTLQLEDTSEGNIWNLSSRQPGSFEISKGGTGLSELLLDPNGNLEITGNLNIDSQSSNYTFAPDGGALSLTSSNSTPQLLIREDTGLVAQRVMMRLENNGYTTFQMHNLDSSEKWNFSVKNNSFELSKGGTGLAELVVDGSGNLTITGALTAAGATFPDYVFEQGYELMPLDEVEAFIQSHGHLPNVPSEQDLEYGKRINMTELQIKMLEKIEELTLYTLDQHKTIREQSSVIEDLKARLEAVETQLRR